MRAFRLVFVFICVLATTLSSDSPAAVTNSLGDNNEHYDLIVIGGGSGGLSAAKHAYSKYKKRVLVIDYVKPSRWGTHWGEGGTCVNVGCIPKKLLHQAALLKEAVQEAKEYGWIIQTSKSKETRRIIGWKPDIELNWDQLITAVQNHVKSVNFVTRTQLTIKTTRKVTSYLNGQAEFVDANTVKVTLKDGKKKTGELSSETRTVTGDKILIAVGGRPRLPDVPGVKEFAITSDELFSLEDPPGATVIIGGGYIGMECAGFLRAMGVDVTVLLRSEVLSGMDRGMAEVVKNDLIERGVEFEEYSELVSIEESFMTHIYNKSPKDGSPTIENRDVYRLLAVKWKKRPNEDGVVEDGYTRVRTVVMATGREAATAELKLENANVKVAENGKIVADNEQTNVPNIYAVGDVLQGKPELTPVAIQAGKLLMDRLYGGSQKQMDYDNVATTVFTPLEYSFVGLSEEKAVEKYGEDNIEVYHTKFSPVEDSVAHHGKKRCYLKMICEKQGDLKILGLHFFGPSAGEVMQGYAVAIKAGLTFQQLQDTVGIHPTVSEEFTRVSVTKRSGEDPTPQSCCS